MFPVNSNKSDNLPQGLKRRLEKDVSSKDFDLSEQIYSIDTAKASLKNSVNVIDKNNFLIGSNIFEIPEIMTVILFHSEPRELLAFWKTSWSHKDLAMLELIGRLNKGTLRLDQLGIKKVSLIINFLGKEKCSLITKLDLRKFIKIADADVELISKSFPMLEFLYLNYANVTKYSSSTLAKMTALKGLDLSRCDIREDFCFEHLNLTELILSSSLESIEFLKFCPALTYLMIANHKGLKNFSPINNCKNLQKLDLSNSELSDISFIADLPNLEILILKSCDLVEDYSPIEYSANLKYLDLSQTKISDISFVKNLPLLEELLLSCSAIQDLSPIGGCKFLKKLDLTNNKGSDISFVKDLTHLKILTLSECLEIEDVSALQHCKFLEELNLEGCLKIGNISLFNSFGLLKKLNISRSNINDISFLNYLPLLEYLNIKSNKMICNIGYLKSCKKLKELDIDILDTFDCVISEKSVKKASVPSQIYLPFHAAYFSMDEFINKYIDEQNKGGENFLKGHNTFRWNRRSFAINFSYEWFDPVAKLFKIAAEQGHAKAQVNLAYCKLHGLGTEVDRDGALKLLSLSEAQGNVKALKYLNYYLQNEANCSDSFKQITFLAGKDNTQDQYILAYLKQYGIGTVVDEEEAISLYRAAAAKGHFGAQNNLYNIAVCKQKECNTPVDQEAVFKLYDLLAQNGYVHAYYNRGFCYQYGIGTPVNIEKALESYHFASMRENADAQSAYDNLMVDSYFM